MPLNASTPRRPYEFLWWPAEQRPDWAGVWPLACGWTDCRRPMLRLINDFQCIHLVEDGQVSVRTRTVRGQAGPGDFFAIFKGMEVSYTLPSRRSPPAHVLWIRLDGPAAAAWMNCCGFSAERLIIPAADPGRARAAMHRIVRLSQQTDAQRDPAAVAALYDLLAASDLQHRPEPVQDSLAHRVVQFMELELHRGLCVADLGRVFGVSRSTLFLHFRRELNKSPQQVLSEMRIGRARRLLADTDRSISEVALAAGFSSLPHFSHQFRRLVGQSPRAYRQTTAPARRRRSTEPKTSG